MKKFTMLSALLLSLTAQTAFSKEYICRPTSGMREGTYIINPKSNTLTMLSDFGNQKFQYDVSNGILTVYMFGGTQVKYRMQNSTLRQIGSDPLNGDYVCEPK